MRYKIGDIVTSILKLIYSDWRDESDAVLLEEVVHLIQYLLICLVLLVQTLHLVSHGLDFLRHLLLVLSHLLRLALQLSQVLVYIIMNNVIAYLFPLPVP